MMTQEALVDSVDQDQNAHNMQSDLWSTLSTFSFKLITELFLHLAMEVYFCQWKSTIYSFGIERVKAFADIWSMAFSYAGIGIRIYFFYHIIIY